MAQVQAGETTAAWEHIIHVGYIPRIEISQVYALEFTAIAEHALHTGYPVGIEILHACDGGEIAHAWKPVVGTGNVQTGKRGIKHHLFHIVPDIGILYPPRHGGSVGRQRSHIAAMCFRIVVEGERLRTGVINCATLGSIHIYHSHQSEQNSKKQYFCFHDDICFLQI